MSPSNSPKPSAYRPFVSARYFGPGRPPETPQWRVLVHRKHVETWDSIPARCGESNARELWEHLTTAPNEKPRLGTVSKMKGRQFAATGDGMSAVYHYEITGAGRVDYRYKREFVAHRGDPHPVVQIVSIDLGSH